MGCNCRGPGQGCLREPAKPEPTVPLVWHAGRHVWERHDGYPRHQHSLNGALTIDPHDPHVHFAGDAFGKSYDESGEFNERESEHTWRTADRVGNLLITYRRHMSNTERQAMSDAMQVLMKLGGKIQRGEIKR